MTDDPITRFKEWFEKAEKTEPGLPDAASLATASAEGAPSVRMVLLKGVDDRGFVFYTHMESAKGRDLAENPRASMCIYWKSQNRQVRVDGPVERVSDEEADAYFATRPRGAQIGAWASPQSRPMKGRFELEREVAKYTAKFHVGAIPRPDFWSGFRILPHRIEFWEERKFRLHDRAVYDRHEDSWKLQRLYP